MSTLLIRADAGPQIGTGHIMRCLALAQAWQAVGGQPVFAVTSGADALLPRLQREGVEIAKLTVVPGSSEDGRATTELAGEQSAAWVVVDGYCFGAEYQKLVKDANLPLLFVDDNTHASHYCADIVLNQNLHAHEAMYANREPHTRLLLGPRFALLRREFLALRNCRRPMPDNATKVLVTIGGADLKNVTEKVIQAFELCEASDLEVKIVAGPIHRTSASLQARSEHGDKKIVTLAEQVDMPALMAWADVAISGAGSTSWELCFMGVPSLLIVVAKNQRLIAEELDTHHAAINLGSDEGLSPRDIYEQLLSLLPDGKRRQELVKYAQDLVNGEGAASVVKHLRSGSLKLRRARFEDCKLLWEWANNPEVRASAFSSAPISWEQHRNWFSKKLGDPQSLIFLGVDADGEPVGQIRFDMDGHGEAVIDVSVAPQHRNFGYGRLLISRGVEALSISPDVERVRADVKRDNYGSQCVFRSAGFREVGSAGRARGQTVHYLKELHHGSDA